MAIQAVSSAVMGAVSHPVASLGNLANKVHSLCTYHNIFVGAGAVFSLSLAAHSYLLISDQVNEQCPSSDSEFFTSTLWGMSLSVLGTAVAGIGFMVEKYEKQQSLAQSQQLQAQLQAQQRIQMIGQRRLQALVDLQASSGTSGASHEGSISGN